MNEDRPKTDSEDTWTPTAPGARVDASLPETGALIAGRYRVERMLGAGGMAIVYLAADEHHVRTVALKVMRPAIAAAIGHERFLTEIKTTARLRHPHILPLYDSGVADGLLFYVMPYVEGQSLRARLQREKQLPIEEAMRIANEVGDALSYAHSQGVIHRDIKPENILLDSGHAVIADFGIARAIHAAGDGTLPQTGSVIGTPAYMSPEAIAGSRDLDGRTDLYSLACVLFELLAGQPPFVGISAESLAHQHLSATPPSVTQFRPAVPAHTAGVLAQALAKNPADRFNPVAQFTEALAPRTFTAPHPVPRRGRRWPLAVSTGIALLAVVAIVVRLVNREPQLLAGANSRITFAQGLELDPALSPSGEMLAYAAGTPGRMQIYVRRLSGGSPLALTSDTTVDHRCPRWSDNGALVAYQADSLILSVPVLGGTSRTLVRLPGAPKGFALSPDGARVAYALDGRVYTRDLRGGAPVPVSPPAYDAHSVAWSPDGTRLAYVVGNNAFVFGNSVMIGNESSSAVWMVTAAGTGAVRVSEDKSLNMSPAWGPDSRDLFWISSREGPRDIYRVRLDDSGRPTGPPLRLTTGLGAMTLSLDHAGLRLAYSVLTITSNIWSVDLVESPPVSISRARAITSGNQIIERVTISDDGRWLAFDSDRGGNFDIYKMPSTGGEAVQLTTDVGKDFEPQWSPDGRYIAFHSMRNGNRDVFTIAADGSEELQRTDGLEEEANPDWSPDGQALQYSVRTPQGDHLRILHLSGKLPPRDLVVPMRRGGSAAWARSGDLICFPTEQGLSVVHSVSGETREVCPVGGSAAWALDGQTIYFMTSSGIWSVSPSGGNLRRLVDFDDPSKLLTRRAVATDGRRFFFTIGSKESDVWTMELARK